MVNLTMTPTDEKPAFIPVEGQSFWCEQDWINRASRVLTAHPKYNNTQHGEATGYRGQHFTALCFDQKGRRCTSGADFRVAKDEDAFPVWWIWPDQIVPLLSRQANPTGAE